VEKIKKSAAERGEAKTTIEYGDGAELGGELDAKAKVDSWKITCFET